MTLAETLALAAQIAAEAPNVARIDVGAGRVGVESDLCLTDPTEEQLARAAELAAWLRSRGTPSPWDRPNWLHCDGQAVEFRSLSVEMSGADVAGYEYRRVTP